MVIVRLSLDEVRHVARLGRLAMTDQQCEAMRDQLDGILAHFEALQELNTDDVEPTSHSLDMVNVFRDDEPAPSFDRDLMLANAPKRDDECFRVPLIMEED